MILTVFAICVCVCDTGGWRWNTRALCSWRKTFCVWSSPLTTDCWLCLCWIAPSRSSTQTHSRYIDTCCTWHYTKSRTVLQSIQWFCVNLLHFRCNRLCWHHISPPSFSAPVLLVSVWTQAACTVSGHLTCEYCRAAKSAAFRPQW